MDIQEYFNKRANLTVDDWEEAVKMAPEGPVHPYFGEKTNDLLKPAKISRDIAEFASYAVSEACRSEFLRVPTMFMMCILHHGLPSEHLKNYLEVSKIQMPEDYLGIVLCLMAYGFRETVTRIGLSNSEGILYALNDVSSNCYDAQLVFTDTMKASMS